MSCEVSVSCEVSEFCEVSATCESKSDEVSVFCEVSESCEASATCESESCEVTVTCDVSVSCERSVPCERSVFHSFYSSVSSLISTAVREMDYKQHLSDMHLRRHTCFSCFIFTGLFASAFLAASSFCLIKKSGSCLTLVDKSTTLGAVDEDNTWMQYTTTSSNWSFPCQYTCTSSFIVCPP